MAEDKQVKPSQVTENVKNAVTLANGGSVELTTELEQQIYNGIMAAGGGGGGGGGGGYVLPVATTSRLGGVKPDGTTITVKNDGAISAVGVTATVNAGTATALPAGSAPTVTNSGTGMAAVFNFGIPAGEKGDTGPTGLRDRRAFRVRKAPKALQARRELRGPLVQRVHRVPKGSLASTLGTWITPNLSNSRAS